MSQEYKTVHFIMQSKGGVGKSYAAWLLAQYLMENGRKFRVYDTDIANHTMQAYRALPVEDVALVDADESINPRRFDAMIEKIIENDEDAVIDTGSNIFPVLWNYVVQNEVISVFQNAGKDVLFHSIIVGGQALADTMNGFASLAEHTTTEGSIVVWLNEFFGSIERENKTFEEFKIVKENKDTIKGIINLTVGNTATEGVDIRELNKAHLTFAEADNSKEFGLMSRQRLRLYKNQVFKKIEGVLGGSTIENTTADA